MTIRLICRDPVEADMQRKAYIRRSCGADTVIGGDLGPADIFGRFDAYMKACGYASSMDRNITGIESILERRKRERESGQ